MCYMADRSSVGVRELRQNLSIYLARVKRGATYTVTEHGHTVALLRPAPAADDVVEGLVAQGLATPARKSVDARPKALALKLKVPLSRQLDAMRDDTI